MNDVRSRERLITKNQLIADLRALGVGPGQVVMAHASVKALGRMMGGPTVMVQALLETLTATGALMMYAGWEDCPDFVLTLPKAVRQRYYDEHPAFDPAIARAVRENGILAEIVRTWPEARRSNHPEASMVAVGAQATWLTQDHPLNYGYGLDSPLDKLVRLNGQVLLLGAPLDTITLLHYAENRAQLRRKKVVRYQCPALREGRRVWIDIEDFDTGEPHDDYTFEGIARDYLAAGNGRTGTVGEATAYLFDAAHLTSYAIAWLESRYGMQ